MNLIEYLTLIKRKKNPIVLLKGFIFGKPFNKQGIR